MDSEEFGLFLKRSGRSPAAVKRCLAYVGEFEHFLERQQGRENLDEAGPEDLEAFVTWVEREPKTSAKTHLWAIRYHYQYKPDEEMEQLAGLLRRERIERKPFALKDFLGVEPDHAETLAAAGVRYVDQMLEAGRTPADRQALSDRTGVPLEAIVELVKLSDLARIPGIKSIRARLYHDAGVDTIEKMAQWDPEALRAMLVEFVARTGFEGIAPLPKEAAFSVTRARRLPKIVWYE